METILLPFFSRANELDWFNQVAPVMMAALVIVLALGFASQIGLRIIKNTSQAIDAINSIKPKPRNFKALAMAEEAANTELSALAKDYGADRAGITLFHNGKTSIGDVHLLSASIKAEGGSGKFPKIAGRVQNVPLLTYGNWTRAITTGHEIEAPDALADAYQNAPDAYLMLEQNSVKSLYVYPVVTPTGDIDGCFFLEYCQEQRDLGETEKAAIRARGQSIYSKLHRADNVQA